MTVALQGSEAPILFPMNPAGKLPVTSVGTRHTIPVPLSLRVIKKKEFSFRNTVSHNITAAISVSSEC